MTLERVMQNLKKNWLVVWKITWGIWQIFTRALESWDSKLGLLWGTFVPSRKCMSLKFKGECHVLWQWRKMQNLKRSWPVQNWHEEFTKFWPEHSTISKTCTLTGCFWPKYIMQRSYVWWHSRLIKKSEGKLLFHKWYKFGEFWSEHWKVSKICTLIGPFQ